jgi:hypothetical protein
MLLHHVGLVTMMNSRTRRNDDGAADDDEPRSLPS